MTSVTVSYDEYVNINVHKVPQAKLEHFADLHKTKIGIYNEGQSTEYRVIVIEIGNVHISLYT